MTIRRAILLTLSDETTPADVSVISAAIEEFLPKVPFVVSALHGRDLALGAPVGRAHQTAEHTVIVKRL